MNGFNYTTRWRTRIMASVYPLVLAAAFACSSLVSGEPAEHYESILNQGPTNPRYEIALYKLGEYYANQDDQRAIPLLEQYIRSYPNGESRWYAQYHLAYFYVQTNAKVSEGIKLATEVFMPTFLNQDGKPSTYHAPPKLRLQATYVAAGGYERKKDWSTSEAHYEMVVNAFEASYFPDLVAVAKARLVAVRKEKATLDAVEKEKDEVKLHGEAERGFRIAVSKSAFQADEDIDCTFILPEVIEAGFSQKLYRGLSLQLLLGETPLVDFRELLERKVTIKGRDVLARLSPEQVSQRQTLNLTARLDLPGQPVTRAKNLSYTPWPEITIKASSDIEVTPGVGNKLPVVLQNPSGIAYDGKLVIRFDGFDIYCQGKQAENTVEIPVKVAAKTTLPLDVYLKPPAGYAAGMNINVIGSAIGSADTQLAELRLKPGGSGHSIRVGSTGERRTETLRVSVQVDPSFLGPLTDLQPNQQYRVFYTIHNVGNNYIYLLGYRTEKPDWLQSVADSFKVIKVPLPWKSKDGYLQLAKDTFGLMARPLAAATLADSPSGAAQALGRELPAEANNLVMGGIRNLGVEAMADVFHLRTTLPFVSEYVKGLPLPRGTELQFSVSFKTPSDTGYGGTLTLYVDYLESAGQLASLPDFKTGAGEAAQLISDLGRNMPRAQRQAAAGSALANLSRPATGSVTIRVVGPPANGLVETAQRLGNIFPSPSQPKDKSDDPEWADW